MSESHIIKYGRTEITFAVERRPRRRTVAIIFDPQAGVQVAAPATAPIEDVIGAVRDRASWIIRQRAKAEQVDASPARTFRSGEAAYYLGRQYRLKVVTHVDAPMKGAVGLYGRYLTVTVPPQISKERDAIRAALMGWYRARSTERLPERVSEFCSRVGCSNPNVLVRDQRKRWGSCSADRRTLRFNLRLIMAPQALLDYVVAHEVCHIEVHDHSARFWKLLKAVMPDYPQRRERLRLTGSRYVL